MSTIRKTPKKAVPSLLARLSKAKEYALQVVGSDAMSRTLDSKFKNIENKLQDMEKSLVQIKEREMMVVEHFGELDDEFFSFEYPSLESRVGDKLKQIEEDVVKLKSLISTVEDQSPSDSKNQTNDDDGQSITHETVDHVGDEVLEPSDSEKLTDDDDGQSITHETIDHVGDEVLESEGVSFLSECFHCLESSQLKMCFLLLSVFPENEAIKKMPLIYWWIGEGLVTQRSNATAEEVGEQIFQALLNHSIIKSITSNSFTVYPWIRRVLIQLAQKNNLLQFSQEAEEAPRNAFRRAFLLQNQSQAMDVDLVTIYNMNEQYLGSSSELLSKPRELKVLQMGRWQDSATHHIEAEDYEMLFERLGSQKHLQYLSLRGISRIETLPQSIGKLTSLLILDLRACHNLDKLPEEVAELRSLTHLDVSECFLLDSMPNGLERLSNLQVLKGFVVSNSCKINDLSGLAYLRKLSIRVGSLGKEQLGSLAGFKPLRILTVLWSEASPDGDCSTVVSLPKTLIKLDLQSVPFDVVPPWMEPSQLPDLEKLYIKGGKLNSLNNHDQNLNELNNHDQNLNELNTHTYEKVKISRLKYLKNLKINKENLVKLFPNYLYLQRAKCHEHDQDLFLVRPGKSA